MQTIKSTPNVLLSRWSNKRFLFLVCILALQLQLASVSAIAQYTRLLDFGSEGGRNPFSSLLSVGTDLYGMTYSGGENDLGIIFKIKPDGSGYSKLLDFNGQSNGSHPFGSFFSDGSFLYGMTANGGKNDLGTVFKIKSDGSGYVKLHDFSGLSDGSRPIGDLISDGTFLYGMTSQGGEFNLGTIFRIQPDGTNFQTQMEFNGSKNGSTPYGSLISDGTFLYGTTSTGGANSLGTLFKVKPDGNGYVDLLDFNGGANGSNPYGSLLSDGKFLYGMTRTGGKNGDGVIFKIKADGTSYTSLLDLQGSLNGSNPWGSLITDGTFLYGVTYQYGANDYGTIFKIKTDGTGFVDLFDFDSPATGSNPFFSTLVSDGTFLYGMTALGGQNNLGTIYKIKSDGTGFNTLHEFHVNGNSPYGSLISDGVFLYGMTAGGGANGFGTIFKISPDGSGYSNLFDFDDTGTGSYPQGSLFFDGTFLYGMASSGGANGSGTIFKIKPDGTGYAKIFDFDYSANGDAPYGSLISDGTFLYGTTTYGGNDGGTVFKIRPNGTGYVTLSDFSSAGAGYQPYGDLLHDGTFLYGTTLRGGANREGTIFKLKPDGTGYTTIFNFGASADGSSPYGSLVSDGTFLYGMTYVGGLGGGTVFKIKPDGTGYVKLRNLVGVDIYDGSNPYGSLSFDGTFLYGLTAYGGRNNLGTLFKMKPDGSEYTILLDFDGRNNGYNPRGSLLRIGFTLYGMTQAGGINTDLGGTVFKYELPNPCPDVVTITATGTELTASPGDSYQWYYFGEVISGATGQSLEYNTLEYGEYAVDIVRDKCTNTATFDYIITGQQYEVNASIQVFPNPTKENLFVTVPEADYTLKIIDPLGRVFLEQSATKGSNELKTTGLPSGLYYLVAKSHDDVIVFKIQKQ